jgi:nucleoside-diphosphate-sugar epimerase
MIYVIGGDGFIGSAYNRYCINNKIAVISINRSNYDKYVGTKCEILINANGNSKKFLSTQNPKIDFIDSVQSVQKSLIDFKFKKYIFLSTSDVYPDCSKEDSTQECQIIDCNKQTTYGFHKYIAELCVQHNAKNWLIIRQGGFVGLGLKKNVIFDVLYSNEIFVNPKSRFQFINTDISASLVIDLAIKYNLSNQIFNLTATGTISVEEIMKILNRYPVYKANDAPLFNEISTKKVSKYVKLPDSKNIFNDFILNKKNIL